MMISLKRSRLLQSRAVAAATLILLATTFLSPEACCEAQEMKSEEVQDTFHHQRQQMVESQIERRGIKDSRVLEAMRTVHRHEFVPQQYRQRSYEDNPLPIGHEQTISQPYIVAIMTELLQLDSIAKVLEIGTGSGYQAAVLAELTDSVYSIEIVEPLCRQADSVLSALGYENVQVRCGDGYRGWPEAAPFNAIIVTAAPEKVPQPLIDQLQVGGRLVIPVGSYFQELMLITKTDSGIIEKSVIPVRFVPMTGEAEEQ
jgi:protein-L-isoaspartate(D-aspartate) O-methyltransferase